MFWHQFGNLFLESFHTLVDTGEFSALGWHKVIEPLDQSLVQSVDQNSWWSGGEI